MQNKSWIGKTLALAILPMALGSAWAQTAPQLTPDEMATGVRHLTAIFAPFRKVPPAPARV